MSKEVVMSGVTMPKLCECGCGNPAPIAKQTKTRNGWIKGKPTRFRPGHHTRAGVIERFEEKILKQANGCWKWTGTIGNGYGRFFFHGRTDWAHRFAYEEYIAPIPAGLTIDHLCRNKICVNPAHLEPVPIRVNILRGEGKAAINFKKTHCLRGHELKGGNLIITNGKRNCLECIRMSKRRSRARDPERYRAYERRYRARRRSRIGRFIF